MNHEQGCSLCILKNLSRKEIPACFFKSIDHEKSTKDWYYEDFAALVEVAKKDGKLYFFDKGQIIIATNGFVKKQQKTPRGEIDLAKQRRTDYHSRKEAGTYE